MKKEEIEKMPLDKYIFWLNSMTITELHKEFLGEFYVLKASDSKDESVMNILANDAILWRFVKEHAQRLAELSDSEPEVIRTAEEINQKAKEYAKLRVKELIDSGTLEPSEDEIADIELDFARGYTTCQVEFSQCQKAPITDEEIRKALENLIFTSEKLWDKVKNIKDTEAFIVSHPIIEEAKTALASLSKAQPSDERFKKPTDKELVEIALLFNDGKIQKTKLRDMIAMTEFAIDRLYENGDIKKPSSKEQTAR